MQWPTIEDLSAMVPLPEGYRYEKLARPATPALIDGIRSWHPDTLSLYGRLIIVAPAHREAKLTSKVMPLAELAGRAMGAEFLFGLATHRGRFGTTCERRRGVPAALEAIGVIRATGSRSTWRSERRGTATLGVRRHSTRI